jgi:hypothetical protein
MASLGRSHIGVDISAHAQAISKVLLIAMIEPVTGQVRARLP